MVKQIDKNEARLRRHRRVRNKISGTAARPRLDVFRSAKHIYAQIIDDEQGVTLVSASTMDKDFNGNGGNVEAAAEIGKKVAAKALEKGITEVVFDRVATFIMAVLRPWLMAPVRAPEAVMRGGNTLWL